MMPAVTGYSKQQFDLLMAYSALEIELKSAENLQKFLEFPKDKILNLKIYIKDLNDLRKAFQQGGESVVAALRENVENCQLIRDKTAMYQALRDEVVELRLDIVNMAFKRDEPNIPDELKQLYLALEKREAELSTDERDLQASISKLLEQDENNPPEQHYDAARASLNDLIHSTKKSSTSTQNMLENLTEAYSIQLNAVNLTIILRQKQGQRYKLEYEGLVRQRREQASETQQVVNSINNATTGSFQNLQRHLQQKLADVKNQFGENSKQYNDATKQSDVRLANFATINPSLTIYSSQQEISRKSAGLFPKRPKDTRKIVDKHVQKARDSLSQSSLEKIYSIEHNLNTAFIAGPDNDNIARNLPIVSAMHKMKALSAPERGAFEKCISSSMAVYMINRAKIDLASNKFSIYSALAGSLLDRTVADSNASDVGASPAKPKRS